MIAFPLLRTLEEKENWGFELVRFIFLNIWTATPITDHWCPQSFYVLFTRSLMYMPLLNFGFGSIFNFCCLSLVLDHDNLQLKGPVEKGRK